MVDFRMNQAASATQRSPAGSTATAGSCCPLFNNLFFMNTFAPQAPLIPAPTDVAAQQCPQLARINANQRTQQQPPPPPQQQPHQPNNVALPTIQTLNQQLSAAVGQQQFSQRPQDHNSNNYSTSSLPLQHLVANRHSAHSCMYLAAALARVSAGFRQSQHQAPQQQHPQNHQATPINQPTNATNPVTTSTINSTNQVPLLNFNNYSSAHPFLDLSTLPAPPIAAHLSSSPIANIQRLTNSISNPGPVAQNLAPTSNAAATTAPSQQQATQNFRDVQPVGAQQQQQQPQLQQHQSQSTPVQQLFQDFNDQFQAILLNQLFPNQQIAPTLGAQTNLTQQPQQQQQIAAPQLNSSRPQTLAPTGQQPVVMSPAQQIATQIPHQLQPSELVFESQQLQHQQQNYQLNTSALRSDTFASTISPASHQSTDANLQQRALTESATQVNHVQPSQQQQQQHQGSQTQFVPQQQHQQPQSTIPPMTLYSLPQMEQALALLANPTVANNLFSHVFNLYLQTGLRTEPHDTYHHASHHFHHHLHNPHHHHHHPNGQSNGQDATMPIDSLAINESKPRGLNRAEIDSLTPYIHTNEKDSRTCVICLSKFELKSKIRPLPCNHAFHAKCVDKWLKANRTCPICRRDALKTYNAKLKRI